MMRVFSIYNTIMFYKVIKRKLFALVQHINMLLIVMSLAAKKGCHLGQTEYFI